MSDKLILTNTGRGFGKLTLGVLPVCSDVPVSDDDLVNKKYVDDSVGAVDVTNSSFTEPISQVLTDTTGRLTNNTVLGKYALLNYNSTSIGVDNTAVGNEALKSNETGASNTGVSANALQSNTTGYSNTAVGYNSMPYNTTGFDNTAIGYNSLKHAQDGRYNTAVGVNSMQSSSNSQYSVAIGYNAGNNSSTWGNASYGITLLGAGTSINGVYQRSTAVGSTAQIKKSHQIVLGTASEVVTIPGFTSAGVVHTDASGDLTRGLIVAEDISNNAVTAAKLAIDISYNGVLKVQDCSDGSVNTQAANKGYVDRKVSDLVGLTAPESLDTLSEIANSIADSSGNRFFALDASMNLKAPLASPTFTGTVTLSGLNSVGIVHTNDSGVLTSKLVVEADISNNTLTSAKFVNNNATLYNTVFGNLSLNSNTFGQENVAIGDNVLKNNTYGSSNVGTGLSALENNTTGSNNVAAGLSALKQNIAGSNNTALGSDAGLKNKSSDNTFIGSSSDIDFSTSTWSSSTAIGTGSTITASNQITLGRSSETVRIPNMSSVGFVKTDASGNLSTTTSLASSVIPVIAPVSPVNGSFYFDTTSGHFRIYYSGAWKEFAQIA